MLSYSDTANKSMIPQDVANLLFTGNKQAKALRDERNAERDRLKGFLFESESNVELAEYIMPKGNDVADAVLSFADLNDSYRLCDVRELFSDLNRVFEDDSITELQEEWGFDISVGDGEDEATARYIFFDGEQGSIQDLINEKVSELHSRLAELKDKHSAIIDEFYAIKGELLSELEPVEWHEFEGDNLHVYPLYEAHGFRFHCKVDREDMHDDLIAKSISDPIPAEYPCGFEPSTATLEETLSLLNKITKREMEQ